MNKLNKTLTLPCGVQLKNRIAKSPMSDSLGNGAGEPTDEQARLYQRWAQGGVAVSFVGEVQVDSRYPEKPGNLVLDNSSDAAAYKKLTQLSLIDDGHLWAQLGHAGALAHLPISTPKGPSALNVEGLQCAGMSVAEVQALPQAFAQAAAHAKTLGFSGVQVHAGHGFLLSQFLSPLFNKRDDDYGGSIEARSRIVIEIVDSVRDAVGADFPVAIRINSTDMLEGGLTEQESLKLISLLDHTTVDLIDISGGTYFPGARSSSESSGGGPYFLEFAKSARRLTDKPIMLTGGFKTRQAVETAINEGCADVAGLARAMVLNPSLPREWLSPNASDPEFPRFETQPAGGVTAWYTMRITAIAEDLEQDFALDLPAALQLYEERDTQRCQRWMERFQPE